MTFSKLERLLESLPTRRVVAAITAGLLLVGGFAVAGPERIAEVNGNPSTEVHLAGADGESAQGSLDSVPGHVHEALADLGATVTGPVTAGASVTTGPASGVAPTTTAPVTGVAPTTTAPVTGVDPTTTAPVTGVDPTTTAPVTGVDPTTTAPSSTVAPSTTGTTLPGGFDRIVTSSSAAITVPAGQHWRIRGPALGGPAVTSLTADLHVMGRLSLDADVTINGVGLYGIHAHGGGVLDIQGTPKSAWVRWGDAPQGWRIGDRLVVSATAPGVISSGEETTWGGSWASTPRPASSPDVVLHGEVLRPEVANMSQSITLRGVTRIMIHESGGVANVHTLKYFRCVECGKSNVLGMYPIHFHLLGDSARGSLVQGVVIENSNFRAYVPHGSNGITFRDNVARNTWADPFWWDLPATLSPTGQPQANNSNNINLDHNLVLGVNSDSSAPNFSIISGFLLGAGSGNRITDSAVSGVYGGVNGSGFHWSERSAGSVWVAERIVSHNNQKMGVHTWQNSESIHPIVDFVGYHNGVADINHGAYTNHYHYIGANVQKFKLHAVSFRSNLAPLTLERLTADVLEVFKHNIGPQSRTVVLNSQIGQVVYREIESHASLIEFRDCGLTPADFILTEINPNSVIEITEGGVVTHRWAAGTWS